MADLLSLTDILRMSDKEITKSKLRVVNTILVDTVYSRSGNEARIRPTLKFSLLQVFPESMPSYFI